MTFIFPAVKTFYLKILLKYYLVHDVLIHVELLI